MTPRTAYLLLALLGLLGGIASTAPDVPAPVTWTLGVPLVLALPGLAAVGALLPTWSGAERLVLAVGLSLMLVVLAALLLNGLEGGLNVASWALVLTSVTVGGSIVAAVRVPQPPAGMHRARRRWLTRGYQSFMFGSAAAVAIGAVVLAAWGATQQPTKGFTTLWAIHNEVSRSVVVGLQNLEGAASSYEVEVRSGDQSLGSWVISDLPDGEVATQVVDVPPFDPDRPQVEVRLYHVGQERATPYREVQVWRTGPADDT